MPQWRPNTDDETRPRSLLRELQAPDQLSLHFNPIGLGSALAPEDAAEHQARTIAGARLADVVPEPLRENFERARKLHLHGVLEYEFFTAAADYALLVLEGALRLRFLSYYEYRIPISRGGQSEILEVADFEPILKAKNTRLRLGEGEQPLPRYLRGLLEWARTERLLPGRETRIVDGALAELRNYAAHPIDRTIGDPVESARMLRDLAEYINCLWGVRAEDGRLFGGPMRRRARVAAVSPDGSEAAQMEFSHVPTLPIVERRWTFAVFLAVDREELILPFRGFAYQEGFQATLYPCERLWVGKWEELIARIEAGEFLTYEDHVEHRDRLFLVRIGEKGPDLARSPQDLLALGDPPDGAWLALVADTPHEAFAHVRDHEPRSGRSCPSCFVEIAGRLARTEDAVEFARSHF
jgi:hypothetical protein